MYLWDATEGIGILHMLLGLLDEFAPIENVADVFGGVHLSLVRTHRMDGMMEGFDTSIVGIEREGSNVVGPVAELCGVDNRPAAECCHVLCAVKQSQSFLRVQLDGFPVLEFKQFFSAHATALILHFAETNEGEAEVSERDKVTRRADRALHIDDGEDVVVEEVDETFDSVELHARIAITERLNLEQNHQLHDVVGHTFAATAGVAHHKVDLQLRELILVDVDVAERTEAGSDTINGVLRIGNLLVEVFAAAQDLLAGVFAQLEFVT